MKKSIFFAAMLAMALSANAEVASTLYLIGEPAGGWDTSKGIEMTKTSDGVFETDVQFNGTQAFGFVKNLNSTGDWTAFNSCRYTPAERNQTPEIGDNPMIYTGDDSNDNSWELGTGVYHFIVDTNTMTFNVSTSGEKPEQPLVDLYFTGDVNNWSFPEEYKLSSEGKVYTFTTGVIRGGLPFKISASNWNPAYTTKNEAMEPGKTYEVTTGDGQPNMGFANDVEDAVLKLDIEAMTLTIEGTSGVDEIAANDSEAEYFSLQGIRVSAPESGLYIIRRGDRISKEYIRR